MIDLDLAWKAHEAEIGAPRGDEDKLHASDLHACDRATWMRIKGEKAIPTDQYLIDTYGRGLRHEPAVTPILQAYADANDLILTHGREIAFDGIVGHLDYDFTNQQGQIVAVVDTSTTASKATEWKYGHTLKTAWYALRVDCPEFAEWVFSFGWGGIIAKQEAHWFKTAEWKQRALDAEAHIRALALQDVCPPAEPPVNPITLETEVWLCGKPGSGKSWCSAVCPKNARTPYAAMNAIEIGAEAWGS